MNIKRVLVPGTMVNAHDKCLQDFGNPPFEVVVKLSELCTYKHISVQEPAPLTTTSPITTPLTPQQQLLGQ